MKKKKFLIAVVATATVFRYYCNKINEKKAELEEINAVKHKKWAVMKAKLSIKYKELVSFYEAAYTV